MLRFKRASALTAVATMLALAIVGCGEEGSGGGASKGDFKPDLAGAPAALKNLYRQPSALLSGGTNAYRAQLADLKGTPIVINKWASWCGPCRAEWGHFQNQAKQRGGEVAFFGVNSDDTRKNARKFLSELPIPYPSYFDPKSEIAAELNAVIAFPATAFISADGELEYVKQGQYASEQDLERDIERYALGKDGGDTGESAN